MSIITAIVVLINGKLGEEIMVDNQMIRKESSCLTKVRLVSISKDQSGQRIDNFLLRLLKGVPKTRVYRILRKGEVRVNSSRVVASYRLQERDRVRIPPIRVATTKRVVPTASLIKLLDGSIIYEDDDILILNKPSGVAVHGGTSVSVGAIEALRYMRPKITALDLVHRLDMDASGCLLLAKKRTVLIAMHEMMRSNMIFKSYLVLVRGRWSGGDREVDAPLQRWQLASGERMVRVTETGKATKTVFKLRQKHEKASLMEVIIHTGRTHQIRVHAAFLGRPIAGDNKYGDREFNRMMRSYGLRRIFLHANKLKFTIPTSGKLIAIEAKLDDELQNVLESLGAT